MSEPDVTETLSRIKTQWTLLALAHQDQGEEARKALHQQLLRYYGAVSRYLLSVVRDPAAAEDLAQEFAIRFLRGDFKGARRDFEAGCRPGASFRNYLRMALRNLARDYWNRQTIRRARTLPADDCGVQNALAAVEDWDRIFADSCREDILDQASQALARDEQETGSLYYTTLSRKTRQPELKAAQLAEQLGRELGKPFTAAGIRQTLHRARERFADLLLEELSRRLETSAPDALEQELSDLNLLAFCQPALSRLRADS